MPHYARKDLLRFKHISKKKPTHYPAPYEPPTYGVKIQYASIEESEEKLSDVEVKLLQEVVGVFLHYARAMGNTMLVSANNLSAAQTKGISATLEARAHLLDYAATHPTAKLRHHSSRMILHMRSDGSCLSVSNSLIRARGYFFFI